MKPKLDSLNEKSQPYNAIEKMLYNYLPWYVAEIF